MSFTPNFQNLSQRKKKISGLKHAAVLRAEANNFKPMRMQPTLIDGVIEGGGALGAAYAGALRALHDNNIWFARVAGTSAGAITAAMIAVGFNAEEIQWLCAAYDPHAPVPKSLKDLHIEEPIDFSSFLDFPKLEDISRPAMRRTALWKALKGVILDEIGRIDIPIPTKDEVTDDIVRRLQAASGLGDFSNLGEMIRKVLSIPLAPLPEEKPHVRDFLPNTEGLRIQFADTMWKAIAGNFPAELMMTNLLHEGGIFEGRKFVEVITKLFGSKIHRNPKATVLFKDLPIPLAVIASDLKQGQMRVYSAQTDPNMIVAEAIRQSMSIPFFFQPWMNGRFVDGGLCSNFPAWLYTDAGEAYWPPALRDSARPKVGFVLGENLAARPEWNVEPPRFAVTGNPPRVDDELVLKPLLAEKIKELGLFAPGEWSTSKLEEFFDDYAVLREMAGVNGLDKENLTRSLIIAGLMSGRNYYDVVIPLQGYHWLDFSVNNDEDDMWAMWDRAWHATYHALGSSQENRPALLRATMMQNSPYKAG